jgi:hypothetical protein
MLVAKSFPDGTATVGPRLFQDPMRAIDGSATTFGSTHWAANSWFKIEFGYATVVQEVIVKPYPSNNWFKDVTLMLHDNVTDGYSQCGDTFVGAASVASGNVHYKCVEIFGEVTSTGVKLTTVGFNTIIAIYQIVIVHQTSAG